MTATSISHGYLPRSPRAALLVGLPCSGKTTWSRDMENSGTRRFAVDEYVHATYGPDATEQQWQDSITEIYRQMVRALHAGYDVILDLGLWDRAQRDAAKARVTAAGAEWDLLFFDVPLAELIRRNDQRISEAERDPAADVGNHFRHTAQGLADLYSRFVPPSGEGERSPWAAQPQAA